MKLLIKMSIILVVLYVGYSAMVETKKTVVNVTNGVEDLVNARHNQLEQMLKEIEQ